MSNEFVLKVIEALEVLKIRRLNSSFGICYNLDESLYCGMSDRRAYRLVENFCVGWKDIVKPDCNPLTVYRDYDFGKWEGTNLELRIDLIDHIINRLKNENVTDEELWSLK